MRSIDALDGERKMKRGPGRLTMSRGMRAFLTGGLLAAMPAFSGNSFNLVDRSSQCISSPLLGLSHNVAQEGFFQAVSSADIFRVPDGPGWRLESLSVRGTFDGSNLTERGVTVRWFPNNGGLPGPPFRTCSFDFDQLGPAVNDGDFDIAFPQSSGGSCEPVDLSPGEYWISVVFNGVVGPNPAQGRYWHWDQTQAGGKVPWVMREMGNVGGPSISCPDWVPREQCSTGVSQETSLCFGISGNTPVTLVEPIPDQFASLGTNFFMDLGANFVDPDGDMLTFAATNLPPSLSINAGTGRISGAITDGAGSPYQVDVTVTDTDGQSDQDSFLLVVADDEVADFRFERLWPVLQQPWYFGGDAPDVWFNGEILYVANDAFSRVQLFTPGGLHIANYFVEGPGGPGSTGKPVAVAASGKGAVYVLTDIGMRVQRLNANGELLGSFGGAQLDEVPGFLAVTDRGCRRFGGCVFVGEPDRVLRFTGAGQYLGDFGLCNGGPPCGGGTVQQLGGLAASDDGYVYLTDSAEDQLIILRYGPDQALGAVPQLVGEFGGTGTGPGQFEQPGDVALDEQGNVYVVDANRIQVFTAGGSFLQEIASGDPEKRARRLTLGPDGSGFFSNDLAQIMRFKVLGDPAGGSATLGFRSPFSSSDDDPGFFRDPVDVASGPNSNLYVADRKNHRIQKFSPDGRLQNGVGQEGSGPGEFGTLVALDTGSVSGSFRLLVLDLNESSGQYRIQRFDNALNVVDEIQPPPGMDYQDMAVGTLGSIFLVTGDGMSLRLTPQGELDHQWGPSRPGGAFSRVALAPNGLLYFVSEGPMADGFDLFTRVGSPVAFLPASFNAPASLTVADDGKIILGEIPNIAPDVPRIKIFSQDGMLLQSIGQYGYFPGSFAAPSGMDFAPNGKLYVTDRDNDNVQVLNPVLTPENTKVIIVAGGGPYPGNNLWETTQSLTNYAYLSLAYQGFTGDDIMYLSSNLSEDLDGNGVSDVDAAATQGNLLDAITVWGGDADHLVVYLADHGSNDAFRLNPASALNAADLAAALDTAQGGPSGVSQVTLVYDACRSGSFMDDVSNPAFNRVVITSAAEDQSAKFVSDGILSFSNQFWSQIFVGADLGDAYALASQIMTASFSDQTPQLDVDGDLQTNEPTDDLATLDDQFIGAGTDFDPGSPTIAAVSDPIDLASGNSATLEALGVSDPDGIGRVYVEIIPPDYEDLDPDKPVQSFPQLELEQVGGSSDYQADYTGFSSEGIYIVNFYAQDRFGNLSTPSSTTVTVGNPQLRKAIIVVGGRTSDKQWDAYSLNGSFAYTALLSQGYQDDAIEEIRYLSNGGAAGVDGNANLTELQNAFSWAGTNARDVVVFLVGGVRSGALRLNGSERLTAAQLDGLLDTLESSISGTLAVVYEGDRSGAFVRRLKPDQPGRRIIVASTAPSQQASFLLDGALSFAQFFWNGVLNGNTVLDAFDSARDSISFVTGQQVPQLDDNGNGEGNDSEDGLLAQAYAIGSGVVQDANLPTIGDINPDLQLTDGGTTATIQVDDVISTGTLQQVFGIVTSPPPQRFNRFFPLSKVVVKAADNGSYAGSFDGFGPLPTGDYASGRYTVSVYARDDRGNISFQQNVTVEQTIGRDGWEGDDSRLGASILYVDDEQATPHNLHDNGDRDWSVFVADLDEMGQPQTYEIQVADIDDYSGTAFNVVIELHHADAMGTPIATTSGGISGSLTLTWPSAMAPYDYGEGEYFVQVRAQDPTQLGRYELRVFRPDVAQTGLLTGAVVDALTGNPVAGAFITTGANVTSVSNLLGEFQLVENPGTYTINVTPPAGYDPLDDSGVPVVESQTTWRLFEVTPSALAPDVQTTQATAVMQESTVLNGVVAPNAQLTQVSFQIRNPPGAFVTIDDDDLPASAPQSDVSVPADLDCGLDYEFRVRAANDSGTSTGQVISFSAADCTPLPVIRSIQVASTTDTSTLLQATVDPSGSDTTVAFRNRPVGGVFSPYEEASMQATGSGDQQIDFPLGGLVCETSYEFQVQAGNGGGTAESGIGGFSTMPCPQEPPELSAVLAGNITDTSVDLSARVDPNGDGTDVFYRLQAVGEPLGPWLSVMQGISELTDLMVQRSDLQCGRDYAFSFQASNSGGTTTSSEQVFTSGTCPEAFPEAVTLAPTAVTQGSAILQGTVDPNDSDTTVVFRYGATTVYTDTLPVEGSLSGTASQDVSANLGGLACDSEYHYQVEATNADEQTGFGGDQTFRTNPCDRILLVDDDDNGPDVRPVFTGALEALGFAYQLWNTDVSDQEPGTGDLAAYDTVIWFTGNASGASTGPSADSEDHLAQYLDSGGCLVVSSQDYLLARGQGTDTPTPLMLNHLGIASGVSDQPQTGVVGEPPDFGGLPASGSYVLDFVSPGLTPATDVLDPSADGDTAFTGSAGSAGVQKAMPAYRTLYLGFPLAAVPGSAEQGATVDAILEYCRGVDLIYASGFENPAP